MRLMMNVAKMKHARGVMRIAIAVATIGSAEVASAQRLLLINNASDNELRQWPGWQRVDSATTDQFLAMPLSTLITYDAIEMSLWTDPRLTTPQARALFDAAVRSGVGLYAVGFSQNMTWLPGSVGFTTRDRCETVVAVPAGAEGHALLTMSDPDVGGVDLSSAPAGWCQIHGSLTVSPDYQPIATAAVSGNPVIVAGQFGCGRVVVRSHHFCNPRASIPVRFTDSIARWLTAPNPSASDSDNDGVGDACDNCPLDANASQSDCDLDLIGDACDADTSDADGDGVADACDTCPNAANTIQPLDGDGDGIDDACDNCPGASNEDQRDCDQDGVGDMCSADVDGDRVADACDNCPADSNPLQWDTDDDGTGNNCDWEHEIIETVTDTMIESNQPTANFGNRQHVFAFAGTWGAETKVLFQFDASGVDVERCPTAELLVYQQTKQDAVVDGHIVTAPWSEHTLTWSSFDNAYDARAVFSYAAEGAAGVAAIDVSAAMREWADGRPNYGLLLSSQSSGVKYSTRERLVSTERPRVRLSCLDREPGVKLLIGQGAAKPRPNLLVVDAVTGETTVLSESAPALTALATAPDGTVYGTTDSFGTYGELYRIDGVTGAATLIGPTTGVLDGANRAWLDDCTFAGATMYCWDRSNEAFLEVDTLTGFVSVLSGPTWSTGTGLASNGSTTYFAPHGPSGDIFEVEPDSGAIEELVRMRGSLAEVTAMTFMNGHLYAIETDYFSWWLVTISLEDGAVRRIVQLPNHSDAITSIGYHP